VRRERWGKGSGDALRLAARAKGSSGERAAAEAPVRLEMPRRIRLWHAGWVVVAASIMLSVIGVYCIDMAWGMREGDSAFARRQMLFVAVGICAGAAAMIPHYRLLVAWTWPLAALATGLLVFVLLPFVPESIVTPRNGARRWINLGITDFQPSELAKVVFVCVSARYLVKRSTYRSLWGLIPPFVITGVPMALILMEPNLGTALLFVPSLLAMLVAAGAKIRHIALAMTMGLAFAFVVAGASLLFAQRGEYPLLRQHQVERIQAAIAQFQGDDRYVQDEGFQGKQAMTLIGAGGAIGRPEATSRALIHFNRLVEPHNDMIFPVFVNRFGLAGAGVLLGLYAIWLGGALAVAGACKDPFGRLIVVGLAAMVASQLTVNVGMTLGLLPITGITLPFVSYGGSSLVMLFLTTGLICNVGMRLPERFWKPSFEFDEISDA